MSSAYEILAQAIASKAGSLSSAERSGLIAILEGFPVRVSAFRYAVFVDYDQSVEQQVKSGKYDWVNIDITSSHFPSIEKGSALIEVLLLSFDYQISSKDLIKEMDKQGLRPATLKELLSLGFSYPDLQRRWIVALGSKWQRSDGEVRVPLFSSDERGRRYDLAWWNEGWGLGWQFASVCK